MLQIVTGHSTSMDDALYSLRTWPRVVAFVTHAPLDVMEMRHLSTKHDGVKGTTAGFSFLVSIFYGCWHYTRLVGEARRDVLWYTDRCLRGAGARGEGKLLHLFRGYLEG